MPIKRCIIFSFLISSIQLAHAQNELNTITTAVPFAGMISNAQSMGSGYVGVVASDNYMQNGLDQNPALLSRGKKELGFQLMNYMPWRKISESRLNLYESAYFQSFGRHAVGFSARHFSLGKITYTDATGNVTHTYPKENYLNFKYAFSFSKNFSMGCGLKYIYSDLTNGMVIANIKTHPAKAIAGDLGFNFRKDIYEKDSFKVTWNLGLAFLNIGNKVRYSDLPDKDFIPQEMKLGTLFTFQWKQKSAYLFSLDLSYQASKLLVPSPPIYETDSSGNEIIVSGLDPNVNSFKGIIQSFYDAPGGSKEEMREIIHQFGTEARFKTAENTYFGAIRAGYFHEHDLKGGRKLITVGLGLGYKAFRLDVAKLFPTNSGSPLNKTYCVNLSFRLDMEGNNFFKIRKEKKSKLP